MIYGLDPGTKESAIVGIDESYNIKYHKYLKNSNMEEELENLSNSFDTLAIEWLQSYGFAVGQDVFLTCRAIGRFEKCWEFQENIYFYARPTILSHITGGVRGKKKAQVRQACLIRFGGSKKGEPLHGITKHKWDAFAVCIVHVDGIKNGSTKDLECSWVKIT